MTPTADSSANAAHVPISSRILRILILVCAALGCYQTVGMDWLRIEERSVQRELHGKILAEGRDGSVLLLGQDGSLQAVQPEQILARGSDESPFTALTPEELAGLWLSRLPEGFEVHRTSHYVILHNASREYVRWCGGLLERLYASFTNYFTRRGVQLSEPQFPLVVIVFANQAQYVEHCREEVGPAVTQIKGHFNLQTNVVTTYDLTGSGGTVSALELARSLARPEVQQNIATVVHEAAHQLANNCGLLQRWNDTPQWLNEGLAMFFETPDLRGSRAVTSVGLVNTARLAQFRSYLSRRPADSLQTLLRDDQRLQNTDTATDAYAESWALVYFLLLQRPREFTAYLERLVSKPPLIYADAEQRIQDFRETVDKDLEKFDASFVRFISRLK
ncbi:MAG: DUF1570 domain-containing protein [Thermogutta sp.]